MRVRFQLAESPFEPYALENNDTWHVRVKNHDFSRIGRIKQDFCLTLHKIKLESKVWKIVQGKYTPHPNLSNFM